jgi:hypothetical protein
MRLATTASAAALVLALALPGCSSDDDAAVPQRSASAAASTGDGGSYASTEQLLAAMTEKGVACTEPQTGTFEGVSQAQSCIVNDAEDVVLLRFASAGERTAYVASKDKLASAVVGVDWAVQTVLPQTAEQLAAALGGEVLLGEGGEAPTG